MKCLTGELSPLWECHYRQFLHSIVGEEGRIEVLINSWEDAMLMDSSVNLTPLRKLLSSLSTWSWKKYADFCLPFSSVTSLLFLITLVLVLVYITSKIKLYEWLCNTLKYLGILLLLNCLVVCRVINVHEFRESNYFLKSWYVQVTLANEYQLCFMEKLYICLKTMNKIKGFQVKIYSFNWFENTDCSSIGAG